MVGAFAVAAISDSTFYRVGGIFAALILIVFVGGLVVIGVQRARHPHPSDPALPKPPIWQRRPPKHAGLKWLALNAGVIVLTFVVVAIVGAAFGETKSSGPDPGSTPYPASAMAQFEAGCEHQSGSASYCHCLVSRVEANVPWASFAKFVSDANASRAATLPARMAEDIGSCRAEAG